MVPVPHETPAEIPTSLDAARRERDDALRDAAPRAASFGADAGRPEVAPADVVALLNRVGECVRALPSFGRTRTRTAAVVAKRTLSAISTCSPSGLAGDDERADRGLPASSYLLCGGQVIRQPVDHHLAGGMPDELPESVEERIDDLARAGALIAAEIDRLQQLGERRSA